MLPYLFLYSQVTLRNWRSEMKERLGPVSCAHLFLKNDEDSWGWNSFFDSKVWNRAEQYRIRRQSGDLASGDKILTSQRALELKLQYTYIVVRLMCTEEGRLIFRVTLHWISCPINKNKSFTDFHVNWWLVLLNSNDAISVLNLSLIIVHCIHPFGRMACNAIRICF